MTRPAPSQVALPDWPALMTTAYACAYLSLGEVSFRFLAKRAGVAPVAFDGLSVVRWRRTDLDRLIDSPGERSSEMPSDVAAPVDLAQAALRRAERRAR